VWIPPDQSQIDPAHVDAYSKRENQAQCDKADARSDSHNTATIRSRDRCVPGVPESMRIEVKAIMKCRVARTAVRHAAAD
jgi:hypothetical protein